MGESPPVGCLSGACMQCPAQNDHRGGSWRGAYRRRRSPATALRERAAAGTPPVTGLLVCGRAKRCAIAIRLHLSPCISAGSDWTIESFGHRFSISVHGLAYVWCKAIAGCKAIAAASARSHSTIRVHGESEKGSTCAKKHKRGSWQDFMDRAHAIHTQRRSRACCLLTR